MGRCFYDGADLGGLPPSFIATYSAGLSCRIIYQFVLKYGAVQFWDRRAGKECQVIVG